MPMYIPRCVCVDRIRYAEEVISTRAYTGVNASYVRCWLAATAAKQQRCLLLNLFQMMISLTEKNNRKNNSSWKQRR